MADPIGTTASLVIEFNVGGIHYATTAATLTRYGDHFLSTLATTDLPVSRDSQGRVFIDRDGRQFGRILEFLRNGKLKVDPVEDELREEAEYYALDALLFYMDEVQPGSDKFLAPPRLALEGYESTSLFAAWAEKRVEKLEIANLAAACELLLLDVELVGLADRFAARYHSLNSILGFKFSLEARDDSVQLPGFGEHEFVYARSSESWVLRFAEEWWATNDEGNSPLAMLHYYRHRRYLRWSARNSREEPQTYVFRAFWGKRSPSFAPEWEVLI